MMTDYTPTRRGRPRIHPLPEPQQPATEAAKPTRRRPRGDIGGIRLKLSAPERKGWFRRWFVDKPGRIAEAEELVYTHVSEQGIKSDGPDSRVRRITGTDGTGAPQYSYLMETPLEEYQAGITDKEEAHATFEESIRRGQDPHGQLRDAYGEGSIRAD